MSKYQQYWEDRRQSQKKIIHPIWGAIGLFLAIIIPVVSYASTLLLIPEIFRRRWITFPIEIYAKGSDPLIYIKILLTILIIILFSFILMMITFIAYRLFGPSRYGQYDVLQNNYRGPRYKR
jgi:hypothetical protein